MIPHPIQGAAGHHYSPGLCGGDHYRLQRFANRTKVGLVHLLAMVQEHSPNGRGGEVVVAHSLAGVRAHGAYTVLIGPLSQLLHKLELALGRNLGVHVSRLTPLSDPCAGGHAGAGPVMVGCVRARCCWSGPLSTASGIHSSQRFCD